MHTCGALCTNNADDCTSFVKDVADNVAGMAVDIAIAAVTGSPINILDLIERLGKTATDLANSICDPPSVE
jgi:hypothetical protein